MNASARLPLILAAALSAGIAILHVVIVVIGPAGYRYFGAPSLAAAAEAGSVMQPVVLTLGIALVFGVWAIYALAGAGLLPRMPLLRAGLLAIGSIYLLRGLFLLPQLVGFLRGSVHQPRVLVFSAVALIAGICYLLGTGRAWRVLGPSQAHVL